MSYPIEAYVALDRLNSWVRSKGYWEWSHHGPKYVIYDWKNELIKAAIKNGIATTSAIRLLLTCRDCDGSKRYTDSYGYKFPHCRKCFSTGVSDLAFLVTRMHGFTWHTPRDKSWGFDLPEGSWEGAKLSVDWEPNQVGKDLETWQVAECLNILEPMLPKPGSHGICDSGDWYGECDHSKYKLHLGRSERICQLCGRGSIWNPDDKESKMDGVHHHVSRGNMAWSAWACDPCKGLYATCNRWSDQEHKYVPEGGNGKSIFDEFPVPKIEHPEILKWLERRMLP